MKPNVELLKFPYPYRAMLTVCTDIDTTTFPRFRNVFRFLRTNIETLMGPGLSLDIADSFWLYHRQDIDSQFRQRLSVFDGLGWNSESRFSDMILECINQGWIDCMHTYGNFSGVTDENERFRRQHAEKAIEYLDKKGVKIRVWMNHGDKCNYQNIGEHSYMEGAKKEEPGYHLDLLKNYGMEYFWSGKQGKELCTSDVLTPIEFEDGHTGLLFERYCLDFIRNNGKATKKILWHPQHLDEQLSEENLNLIVEKGEFSVIAQHLGVSGGALTILGESAVQAFKRLARFQADGLILVTRTSRLMDYYRAWKSLDYSVSETDDEIRIHINGQKGSLANGWEATLDQIRGISFRIPGEKRVSMFYKNKPVPEGYIGEERISGEKRYVYVAWFRLDPVDIFSGFETNLGTTIRKDITMLEWARNIDDTALKILTPDKIERPENVPEDKLKYAIDYSMKMHSRKLEGYIELFDKLGFREFDRGLDVGSGAGHWCLAFLAYNGNVEGIDTSEAFVSIASQIAEKAGLSDRVNYKIGTAELLPYSDNHFNAVWTHSVLMFTETEKAINEISRCLAPGGFFYCGYSSIGFRLAAIRINLINGNLKAAVNQLINVIKSRLYKYGIQKNYTIRCHTADELALLFAANGLRVIDRPGLQEGQKYFIGLTGTVDFVLKKDKKINVADEIIKLNNVDCRYRLQELIDAGAVTCAISIIEQLDRDLKDLGLRDLWLLASLKSGRANDGKVSRIAKKTKDLSLRIAATWEQRDIAKSLKLANQVKENRNIDGKTAFLAGVMANVRGDKSLSRKWFEKCPSTPEGDYDRLLGIVLVDAAGGDIKTFAKSYTDFLEFCAVGDAENYNDELEPLRYIGV